MHESIRDAFRNVILESDTRLSQAQRVFQAEFGQDRIEFSSLSTVGAADLANRVQMGIAQALGVGEPARLVSPESISALLNFTDESRNILLAMRHGQQQAVGTDFDNLDESDRKIKMMQNKHNVGDPLTPRSIAEAFGTALVLRYISENTGQKIKVKTSGNMRSMQVAAIISAVTGGNFLFDNRLNCVDYPDNLTEEQRTLLRDNKGALAWGEMIDTICGRGKRTEITRAIEAVRQEALAEVGLTVCVTHTQQLNALDESFGDDSIRLSELGYRAINSDSKTLLFKEGFYPKPVLIAA